MRFIVSLPWYDLREVRPAVDAFWLSLRRHLLEQGIRAPQELDRTTPPQRQWLSSDLLLSQACGYDAVLPSRHCLQLVATPSFSLPGLKAGHYQSMVVVSRDSGITGLEDLRDGRCAINNETSHSGMNCLRFLLADLHRNGRFFSQLVVSGGHRRSLQMVAEGRVEVAAVDRVSLAILQEHDPELTSRVRVIATTAQAPAPPYVTSQQASSDLVEKLRQALTSTFADPETAQARRALLLDGIEFLNLSDYEVLVEMEEEAQARIQGTTWPSHTTPR